MSLADGARDTQNPSQKDFARGGRERQAPGLTRSSAAEERSETQIQIIIMDACRSAHTALALVRSTTLQLLTVNRCKKYVRLGGNTKQRRAKSVCEIVERCCFPRTLCSG